MQCSIWKYNLRTFPSIRLSAAGFLLFRQSILTLSVNTRARTTEALAAYAKGGFKDGESVPVPLG